MRGMKRHRLSGIAAWMRSVAVVSRRGRKRDRDQHRRRPVFLGLEDRQLLTNFSVTNLNDSGAGTLRQAIIDANNDPFNPGDPTADSISFNLTNPPSTPTINLNSTLPPVTRPQVVIVGNAPSAVPTGAPGERSSGGVILDGAGIQGNGFWLLAEQDVIESFFITGFGMGSTGISVSADGDSVLGCTIESIEGSGITVSGVGGASIEGNLVSGNTGIGIFLFGPGTDGNVVSSNYVGIAENGDSAFGNDSVGVGISDGASDNAVFENVISGNHSAGVFISDVGTTGNKVDENLIGTNASGISAVGNSNQGIFIGGGATDNTVGGGNVISGNNGDGVDFDGSGTVGNVVEGNRIGTDGDGTGPVRNTGSGISISASASDETISSNVISGNGGDGILMNQGSSSNVVQGNLIGVDSYGTAALGNSAWGVIVDQAPSNTVGGSAAGARNVISGNNEGGLAIYGGASVNDVAEGNYIGTDVTGTVALGNAYGGIYVGSGSLFSDNPPGSASFATIGGTVAGAGNLISGNDTALTGNGGIVVYGSGASNNLIEGNQIGVNSTGTAALANLGIGVDIFGGATSNTVGGATATAANVVSGNQGNGIDITGSGTSGNVVAGNIIGTNAAGATGLGNSGDGVDILSGATNNTIGGTVTAATNTIVDNTDVGVAISDTGTSGNVVEGNFIGTNAAGATGLGNTFQGVFLFNGTTNNTIGGTAAGAGNVIAGNATASTSSRSYSNLEIDNAGTSGNVVQGNFIGTNASGKSGLNPSFTFGAFIGYGASGNTIGGTTSAARNIISGNTDVGVYLFDTGPAGNLVQGNFIGTNVAGTAPLPNQSEGVLIATDGTSGEPASNNTIAGNVIAGNGPGNTTAGSGIALDNAGSNLIENNFIGTNASGATGLGNGEDGVHLLPATLGSYVGTGAPDNTITGNTIADNAQYGVLIDGTTSTGNVVQGNYIGTNASGAIGLGNTLGGVLIDQGASGNTIGGTAIGTGNVIANNAGNGVTVGDSPTDTTVDDSILGNSIYGNTKLGIDLGDDGVTLNNSEGHTGPNLFQDFPVITSAVSSSSATTITGTVSGPANSLLRVELFVNPAADPSGYGQGKTFLNFVVVAINGSGQGSFSYTTTTQIAPGQVITATATDASGNTSEFSKDATVIANVTSQIGYQITGPVYNRFRNTYAETLTLTNDGATTIAGPIQVVIDGLTAGVTLTNATGTAPDGSPYVTTSTSLAPGQSVSVTLTFTKTSTGLYINYTPTFYSGSFPS
jgi:hypothetical protein